MYFSKISLRPDAVKSKDFWNVATGPYQIHSMVWDLFSDSEKRERDFLYRVDSARGKPVIYCVSAREPIYSGTLWDLETKPYNPQVPDGRRLGFSLRANPVVTKTVPETRGENPSLLPSEAI